MNIRHRTVLLIRIMSVIYSTFACATLLLAKSELQNYAIILKLVSSKN